jgi:hypothetical protein
MRRTHPRGRLRCALLLILALSGRAAAGEYAADFIHLGTGADAAGMAGAWSTSKAGATSFYWNPALVLDDLPLKVYVEGVQLFDGLSSYQTAAAQLRLRQHWALSAGVQAQLVDDIPRYAALADGRDLNDPDQRSDGGVAGNAFEGRSLATTIGLSREFWFDILLGGGLVRNRLPARLAVGGAWRLIRETLDEASASGSGMDLGLKLLLAEPPTASGPGRRELVLALARQNLLSQDLGWDTPSGHEDPLPGNTRVGISFRSQLRRAPLAWRLALEHETVYDGLWRFGGEAELARLVVLRGGLASPGFGELRPSFGAGLHLRHALVNYAFSAHELGASHRVALELRF